MKIAICEDDCLFSSFLKYELEKFFIKRKVDVDINIFPDGKVLLEEYKNINNYDKIYTDRAKSDNFAYVCKQDADKSNETHSYDLIFMDIGLENSDGIDIALKVRKFDKKAILIFVTSIEERAVEGYDANTFAYIIKNKVKEKLPETLERLWYELNEKRIVVINDKNNMNLLYTDDVLCIESYGRGIILYTYEDVIKANESISQISSKLPADLFVECHKAVYINVEKIKRIDADILTLINGRTFPISRRNKKNVMAAVMDRVSKKGI